MESYLFITADNYLANHGKRGYTLHAEHMKDLSLQTFGLIPIYARIK